MAGASLTEAFLAGLRGPGGVLPAGLEQALQVLVQSGRSAWPGVELPPAEFVRGLAERLDEGEAPLRGLALLRTDDLWLALSCARGDPKALALFDARLLSRVPQLVRRVDSSGALGPEVVQELRVRLLLRAEGGPRIADYSGRGDLAGWLRVVALRCALKLRRARRGDGAKIALDDPRSLALHGDADPERDYLRVRYGAEYQEAFRDALAALDAPDRLLLKLHYVDQLSLERLAALHRVHRATTARRLADARRKVLDLTRARLRERLRLSDSEFESVLQLVRSQLASGLRGALARGD